jgi:hypothetical protein
MYNILALVSPFVKRYIGIDFSGNVKQWGGGRSTSNIWIADASLGQNNLVALQDLRPVQQLPGTAKPFERLVAYLNAGGFECAAIDAPFSVPADYVMPKSHSILIDAVAVLPRHGKSFAKGGELIKALVPDRLPRGTKVYRQTERLWIDRGINVRSTLWNGIRGGAPFAVACMTLLHAASRPMWPWSLQSRLRSKSENAAESILVEAFPAAQLHAWALPCQGYAKDEQQRRKILGALQGRGRLVAAQQYLDLMIGSADPLDAVICVYAAKAASEDVVLHQPSPVSALEGWIAVHR